MLEIQESMWCPHYCTLLSPTVLKKGEVLLSLRCCFVKYNFTFLATTRFINLKFWSYVVGVLLAAEFFFWQCTFKSLLYFPFFTLSFSVFYNWWGLLLLRNPIKWKLQRQGMCYYIFLHLLLQNLNFIYLKWKQVLNIGNYKIKSSLFFGPCRFIMYIYCFTLFLFAV